MVFRLQGSQIQHTELIFIFNTQLGICTQFGSKPLHRLNSFNVLYQVRVSHWDCIFQQGSHSHRGGV